MFRKFLLTVLTLSGVSFLPIAHADKVVDDRWYIAPFGTFVQPGGDRQSDNGWGGGLGFGKILNEHFNVELKGFYQKWVQTPKFSHFSQKCPRKLFFFLNCA